MAGVARLTQTITIVDKSNKVVGASKQLKDVFYEAKAAYLERKAEIKAERKKKEEKELQKVLQAMSVADQEDRRSDVTRSKTHRHSRKDDAGTPRRRRNSDEHSQYSHIETNQDARYSNNARHDRLLKNGSPRSPTDRVNRSSSTQSRSAPVSPIDPSEPSQMIRRSRTDVELATRPKLQRSNTTPDAVDLDLAYGDFHDGDLRTLSRTVPQDLTQQAQQQQELNNLVKKCQGLLDEANCAQHSARKIVSHLQSNPDAMAAVALTLAEISNVAAKMAPGALAMFKTSAPAVMALLVSPQFLIAVGVGIGVTVVMFGGYKIVKKIKAHKSQSADNSQENLAYGAIPNGNMDEALDVHELDRIENWRRGIANAHAESLFDDGRTEVSGISAASYTSVEGEIITPFAAQSMGHLPLRNKDKKSKKEKKEKEKDKKISSSTSKRRAATTTAGDEGDDDKGESVSVAGSESVKSGRDRQLIKVKKPSPLRRMFISGTSIKS